MSWPFSHHNIKHRSKHRSKEISFKMVLQLLETKKCLGHVFIPLPRLFPLKTLFALGLLVEVHSFRRRSISALSLFGA